METSAMTGNAATSRSRSAVVKIPFIVVFCGDEKYLFYYTPGKEEDVVCAMIDYALDDRHKFGWPEVRSIVKHLGLLKPKQAVSETT